VNYDPANRHPVPDNHLDEAEQDDGEELVSYAPEIMVSPMVSPPVYSASDPRALYDYGWQVVIDLTAPVQDSHIRLSAAKVLLDEFREVLRVGGDSRGRGRDAAIAVSAFPTQKAISEN